jgi:hypothetical protein
MVKHEKTCSNNQHAIISLVFDIFDFLAQDVIDLLKTVQRIIHNKIVFAKFMDVIFKMIDFAIKKMISSASYFQFIFHSYVIIFDIYKYNKACI